MMSITMRIKTYSILKLSNFCLGKIYIFSFFVVLINFFMNNIIIYIFIPSFFLLYEIIQLNFIVSFCTFYVICIIYWGKFNLVHIIKGTIIFRIIIFSICFILTCFNISNTSVYLLLYTFIFLSFVFSNKKIEWCIRLLFVLSFWCLVYFAINLVISNDSTTHSLVSYLLTNYFLVSNMIFFDIDPDYYSEIYQKMYELLKDLNIQHSYDPKIPDGFPKGYKDLDDNDDKDTDKVIYQIEKYKIPKMLLTYKNIFIPITYQDIDIYAYSMIYDDISDIEILSAKRLESISKLVEANNKTVKYMTKQDYKENLKQINKSLSRNLHLEKITDTTFFDFDIFSSYFSTDKTDFFHKISTNIEIKVLYYNQLMGAKFFFEKKLGKNSSLTTELPAEFEAMWKNFYGYEVQRTFYNNFGKLDFNNMEKSINDVKNRNSNGFLLDTTKKEIAFKKLLEFTIYTGMSILSQVHMYNNMLINHTVDSDIFNTTEGDMIKFQKEAWDYYEESVSKYHVFYDFYNWNMKVQSLKSNAEKNIILNATREYITIKDKSYNPKISATYNLPFDEKNNSMERFLLSTKQLLKNKNFKDKASYLKLKTSKYISKFK